MVYTVKPHPLLLVVLGDCYKEGAILGGEVEPSFVFLDAAHLYAATIAGDPLLNPRNNFSEIHPNELNKGKVSSEAHARALEHFRAAPPTFMHVISAGLEID